IGNGSMKLRDSLRTISAKAAPRFARLLAAVALFSASGSVVSCGGTKRVEVVKPSEKEGFVRVEDLPPAPKPGFVRVDELAPAAPVAVRPLKPKELTRELIRRADSLLKKDESKVGTQVLVEVGDK